MTRDVLAAQQLRITFESLHSGITKMPSWVSSLLLEVPGGLGGSFEGHDRIPTAFAAEDAKTCDWHNMMLGNNVGIWKPEKAEIKYQYDYNLKGEEVHVYWPGKTAKGPCNDTMDDKRGCWYRARLLNDVGCRSENRCLHFAAHDGEARHSFTCPSWIRRTDGSPCALPEPTDQTWQACPVKFNIKRVDSGVPQDFKKALLTQCPVEKPVSTKQAGIGGAETDEGGTTGKAKKDDSGDGGEPTNDSGKAKEDAEGTGKKDGAGEGGETLAVAEQAEKETLEHPQSLKKIEEEATKDKEHDEMVDKFVAQHTTHIEKHHCVGSTKDDKDANMLFDIKHNSWFRCTPTWKCEPFDIREIQDPRTTGSSKCGDKLTCKDGEQCFVHRVTSKQSTHECVPGDKVLLLSEGDDVAKFSVPLPLALPGPPPFLALRTLSRSCKSEQRVREFL